MVSIFFFTVQGLGFGAQGFGFTTSAWELRMQGWALKPFRRLKSTRY